VKVIGGDTDGIRSSPDGTSTPSHRSAAGNDFDIEVAERVERRREMVCNGAFRARLVVLDLYGLGAGAEQVGPGAQSPTPEALVRRSRGHRQERSVIAAAKYVAFRLCCVNSSTLGKIRALEYGEQA